MAQNNTPKSASGSASVLPEDAKANRDVERTRTFPRLISTLLTDSGMNGLPGHQALLWDKAGVRILINTDELCMRASLFNITCKTYESLVKQFNNYGFSQVQGSAKQFEPVRRGTKRAIPASEMRVCPPGVKRGATAEAIVTAMVDGHYAKQKGQATPREDAAEMSEESCAAAEIVELARSPVAPAPAVQAKRKRVKLIETAEEWQERADQISKRAENEHRALSKRVDEVQQAETEQIKAWDEAHKARVQEMRDYTTTETARLHLQMSQLGEQRDKVER